MPKPNSFAWKETAPRPFSLFKWEERKYVSLMNSISSCGLFWAKQPLALFALLISQMGKRDDIWHQKRITQKNFINIFLLSSLDSSSVSGREHCSLEMCWKQWMLPVCSLYSFHFIFCLFKDCNIECWTWTLTPGSHSGWLILDEACVAPGLSRECYDLPSKERGKWKHSLVVSSPLGDNSFFSCSWQKEEAGPPLPFCCFFFLGKTEVLSYSSVFLYLIWMWQ